MLLAEIHGKRLEPARNNEDYLTSAVFGHLRYVPPALFWHELFAAARGLPGPDGVETSLGEVFTARGTSPVSHARLELTFWQSHPTLGEPDLLLVFSGGTARPLVVLVEVKLWAEKTGTDENDQLARYLCILDDLGAIEPPLPRDAERFLVYLTPRESLAEVAATAALLPDSHPNRNRLFRIQWQDVLVAAESVSRSAPGPGGIILRDVAAFLRRLGLEYFSGFTREPLGEMPDDLGEFYRSPCTGFRGFGCEEGLGDFDTVRRLCE